LSPTSISYHLTILRMILGHAHAAGVLLENPARRVPKLPRRRNTEDAMRVLTPDEVARLLEGAGAWRPLFTTAVLTGLRLGELLGLQWQDVDFQDHVLHVRRALGRHGIADGGSRLVLTQPKGKRSRRVEFGAQVANALRELPSRFGGDDEFVFCQANGRPLDPGNLTKRGFAGVLKQVGLRRIRFHDLRHTFASLLLLAGANVKYLQAQLGHASITTILHIYAHLMPAELRDEQQRLSRVVFGRTHNQGAVGGPLGTPAARGASELDSQVAGEAQYWGFTWSGRADLNRRPPEPHSGGDLTTARQPLSCKDGRATTRTCLTTILRSGGGAIAEAPPLRSPAGRAALADEHHSVPRFIAATVLGGHLRVRGIPDRGPWGSARLEVREERDAGVAIEASTVGHKVITINELDLALRASRDNKPGLPSVALVLWVQVVDAVRERWELRVFNLVPLRMARAPHMRGAGDWGFARNVLNG
jgi:integrase